jgi:hypothetical protein
MNAVPNLSLADPTRVAGWRSMMTDALKDVQHLVHARANYDRFAALVRANDHVLHGESDFPSHVQRWFVDSAAMSVRRIVEPNSSTGDIRSLRVVLDDMHRAARAFTSASVAELFDAPDAPQYDAELRAFLIASMWENVAASHCCHEQLNAKMLKDDRKMLALVSDRITDIVDKMIAHRTTSQHDHALSYPELSTCVDVIEAIALRYQAALLGPSMTTLVPVDQFNWYDIFRRDWLY